MLRVAWLMRTPSADKGLRPPEALDQAPASLKSMACIDTAPPSNPAAMLRSPPPRPDHVPLGCSSHSLVQAPASGFTRPAVQCPLRKASRWNIPVKALQLLERTFALNQLVCRAQRTAECETTDLVAPFWPIPQLTR